MKFNSDGELLSECGKDRTIRLCKKSEMFMSLCKPLKFSPSCGGDRQVFYWDVSTTHAIQKFWGHDSEVIDTFTDSVMSVCLTKSEIVAGSVNGSVFTFGIRVARCLDSTLHILDRTSGELLQDYNGHTCKDGLIYFWDLVDVSVTSGSRAHSSVVTSVSYNPKDNI
ncbi:hypothetical protein MKW94_018142 [Papaver nudicaule]|uniref:Uncharacterized protein n=1 Tax=Papaver nudicaule TaxID=74823 RepID=A0AA41SGR8_PAPNU|nr:hypothetical protein [Papaver nudicaule]